MAVHTCFFQNSTPFFVKVVVGSVIGQTGVFVPPGSSASLFLNDGTKVVGVFDTSTGSLLSLFPIFVAGPQVFQVVPPALAVPPPVGGAATTGLLVPQAVAGGPSF